MKRSVKNTPLEELYALSIADKESIVFGGVTQDFCETDVVILLGGPLSNMKPRALAAYELYKAGLVKKIIPSGAPKRETEFGLLSECDYMSKILVDAGVNPDDIIAENEALTTHENMIYGALQINKTLRWFNVKRVTIVSSYSHMKRSMALAGFYFPKFVKLLCYHSTESDELLGNWVNSDVYGGDTDYEIRLLKQLIDDNQMDDILF